MTTKAQAIRQVLKKQGYNNKMISVTTGRGCMDTSITVTIKDMNIDNIIEAKGIERTFDLGEVKVKALRGIDLTVKKGEFLVNIVITIGFAIWTLYPYYNSYFGWEDSQKEKMLSVCENDANKTVCICIDEKVFKEYTHQDYMAVDKNSSEYLEFMKEAKTNINTIDNSLLIIPPLINYNITD